MNRDKKPAKSKLQVLAQLCKLIPPHLLSKLARKYGVDEQERSFTPWSHVVSLLFAQLSHSVGLNDVCDARPPLPRQGEIGTLPEQPIERTKIAVAKRRSSLVT